MRDFGPWQIAQGKVGILADADFPCSTVRGRRKLRPFRRNRDPVLLEGISPVSHSVAPHAPRSRYKCPEDGCGKLFCYLTEIRPHRIKEHNHVSVFIFAKSAMEFFTAEPRKLRVS